MMLEEYLRRNADIYSGKTAVACSGVQITYRQLYDEAARRARQLDVRGRLVPFRASQTIDFIVDYFSVHLAGGVAVPLEADLSDAAFMRYQSLCRSSVVPEGTADVLFTTGTTGTPKGVVVSSGAIVADAENLVEAQGYTHDTTFVVNGPLNHIGSLSKIYPIILVGGTIYIVGGMKNADAFFKAVDEAGGNAATFLVPASIRMLLAFAEKRLASCRDKIDFMETGAAPISSADMQHLCSVLPKSRLFNTYASTETGIIATYDFNGGECLAGCLGKAMRNSAFSTAPDGHIVCSGKTLMTGYLDDADATAAVLRDGEVHTADFGYIDDEGRLRLTGRAGDVINVGGYKVIPTEVEDVAMSLPSVSDCVCVAASHPVLGQVLKLLVVVADGFCFEPRLIAQKLKERLEPYKVPQTYARVETVKRTFNGKIDRKAYR